MWWSGVGSPSSSGPDQLSVCRRDETYHLSPVVVWGNHTCWSESVRRTCRGATGQVWSGGVRGSGLRNVSCRKSGGPDRFPDPGRSEGPKSTEGHPFVVEERSCLSQDMCGFEEFEGHPFLVQNERLDGV